MKDRFYLHFETMPKGIAQQIRHNRRTGAYFKNAKLASAEAQFLLALKPYAPKMPSDKPIKLSVWFYFDVRQKRLWGKPKTTRPDTDNYLKLFKDCMTKLGFWKDDAQVVDEHTKKYYAERATIIVEWEEIEDE
jgi:Holliday junction resolvase RusA-like endonuclease